MTCQFSNQGILRSVMSLGSVARLEKPESSLFRRILTNFLVAEFATNELLNYYGCSIANTRKEDSVIVHMRHAIQVQWNPLNVITLGRFKSDSINRMITLSDYFNLQVFNKWDA